MTKMGGYNSLQRVKSSLLEAEERRRKSKNRQAYHADRLAEAERAIRNDDKLIEMLRPQYNHLVEKEDKMRLEMTDLIVGLNKEQEHD